MKKVSRQISGSIIATALLVAPLGTLLPSQAYAAGEYVTLSTFSGHAGSVIQVSGGNFLPNEVLTVFSGQNLGTVSATSNAYGQFGPISYTIPLSSSGSLPISVVGGTETANNSFYVQPYNPEIKLSSSAATPFTPIQISGSGFMPAETVEITLGSLVVSAKADVNGAFQGSSVTVPNITAGTQKVVATGSSSAASAVGFLYVNGFYASVSPSASYLIPGQSLSFSGSGFAPNEDILVTKNINGTQLRVAAFSTLPDGSFKKAGAFVISASEASQTSVYNLVGQTSLASGKVSVSVGTLNPLLSLSDYYLIPGTTYTASVSGFLAGENVRLKQDMKELATVTADSSGSAQFKGLIFPISPAASLTFTAVGVTSAASASASVTVGQFHPFASVDNSYATPGTLITFTGGGFAPAEHVSLNVGSIADVAVTVADRLGKISGQFTMPKSAASDGATSLILTGTYGEAPLSVSLTAAPFLTQLVPNDFYPTGGKLVTFYGIGFAPGENVSFKQGTQQIGINTVDKTGKVGFQVRIPYGGAGVTYVATGEMSMTPATVTVGVAAFQPNVSFSSYFGVGGAPITLIGSGFAPQESVDLTWAGSSLGSLNTDAKGNFSVSGSVPFGKAGPKIFTATGVVSNTTASATFTQAVFSAYMSLSSYYGTGGSPITVNANGFVPNEVLDFNWDGTDLGTINADGKGGLKVSGSVPYGTAGDKLFTITGKTSGAVTTSTFTIAPSYVTLQLDTYVGAPGSAIIFIGTGYLPGETINVMTDRTSGVVYSFKADMHGAFHDSGYIVPTGFAKGNLTVSVTGVNSMTSTAITFYVTGK